MLEIIKRIKFIKKGLTKKMECEKISKTDNIISLGHFCSPALELRDLGIRKASYPFDWLVTPDTEVVIKLIENGFEGFLLKENMYQIIEYPMRYRDIKCNIDFYHDFSILQAFEKQYEEVFKKYERRIKRFYNDIAKPTLFLRYISCQRDMEYVSKNYDYINSVIKKYSVNNHILFIANNDIVMDNTDIDIFFVDKDVNDTVCRKFIQNNENIKEYIFSKVNVEEVKNTSKRKKKFTFSKLIRRIALITKLYYKHDKRLHIL